MKSFVLILLGILFMAIPVFSQNVSIPDTAFLNALVDLGIDTNDDGLISQDEAEVVTYLDISDRYVSSVAGIEAFTSLDSFNCQTNQITYLDLNSNIALEWVICDSNQITNLFVSNNIALKYISCSLNQLTTLDISNNTALIEIAIAEMPSLYEVCVWTMPFPPDNVIIDSTQSPNVYFTDCYGAGIEKYSGLVLSLYPNPIQGVLTLESNSSDQFMIEINSQDGRLVYQTKVEGPSNQIDLSFLQRGVYFILVKSGNHFSVHKIIKL